MEEFPPVENLAAKARDVGDEILELSSQLAIALEGVQEVLPALDAKYEEARNLQQQLKPTMRAMDRQVSRLSPAHRRDRFRASVAWALRQTEMRELGRLHDSVFGLSHIKEWPRLGQPATLRPSCAVSDVPSQSAPHSESGWGRDQRALCRDDTPSL